MLKNEKYKVPPLAALNFNEQWLHVRPHILTQGRVTWFDEEKARRERLREERRQARLCRLEEMEEEGLEEEEEEEVDEEDGYVEGANREIGPPMLSSCSADVSAETPVPWVRRFTSHYTNKNERLLMMRSNVWPGAHTFVYEDFCESIYIGWGNKYVARNFPWTHISPVAQEHPHGTGDFLEADDPTVEMEEAYRLYMMKKELFKEMHEDLGEYKSEDDDDDDNC